MANRTTLESALRILLRRRNASNWLTRRDTRQLIAWTISGLRTAHQGIATP